MKSNHNQKALRFGDLTRPFATPVVNAEPEELRVSPRQTENCLVYELGNGQWNIPTLPTFLEKVLPQHSFFKDFEMTHRFEAIGAAVEGCRGCRGHFGHKYHYTAYPVRHMASQ